MLKILTPPATYDLTTLARVKEDLAISTTCDDAFLASLITTCSSAAESFCRRSFGLTGYQETFRRKYSGGYCMEGLTSLVLSRFPLVSITSVVEDSDAPLTADVDFDFDASGVVSRLCDNGNRVRDWNSTKILVTYTAGYLLPNDASRTLPADVERAVILMIKAAYCSRTRDPLIKSENVAGVDAVTYGGIGYGSSDLLPEAESLLSPYRLPVF